MFVAKDSFKFSCAHMTVFPDGNKERLHGHNYQVEASLGLSDESGALIDFGPLKRAVESLCREWRERLLLAERNQHFEVLRDQGGELEFRLCGRRYVVPREDALLLPIENVVVEQLAELFAQRLIELAGSGWPPGAVTDLVLTVTESRGQGADYRVWL